MEWLALQALGTERLCEAGTRYTKEGKLRRGESRAKHDRE